MKTSGKKLIGVSKRLRESVDEVKGYKIVDDEKDGFDGFGSFPVGVSYGDYQNAQKLKKKLIKKYKGKALRDVIVGEEFITKNGRCYHIQNENRFDLRIIDSYQARKNILSDLKLIYGIGESTEWDLKNEGYRTIEDLTKHYRFGPEASKFLKIFERGNTCQIINWLMNRIPKSHPLILQSSSLHKKEDFRILDIETLGLFNAPIILFGIAQISDNNLLINQYFLRNIKEEAAALTSLLSHFRKNDAIITFNGRTFDIPYIKARLAYYGIKGNIEKAHFDILHFSRRAWKAKVPDCKLTTLEKYLFDIKRKDDVPSALVPEFYETYMRTKNVGPLIPIIEHNKQDLITLANIFSKLHTEWK